MKREIKIRVWDDLMIANPVAMGPINTAIKNTEFVMQYTGLKDKNGVEIYEGDIVREKLIDHTLDEGWYWLYSVVEFVSGCWVLKEVNYDYSGMSSLIDFDHLYLAAEVVEVCGNVFENPELLKP